MAERFWKKNTLYEVGPLGDEYPIAAIRKKSYGGYGKPNYEILEKDIWGGGRVIGTKETKAEAIRFAEKQ